MAKEAQAQGRGKVRRREKKNIASGVAHVNASFNNTMITITDAQGNTIQALHVGVNTTGCVVVSDAGHLIATIGVSNLLIIQDGNATLVADRRDEAAVKEIVDRLKKTPGLEKYL